MRARLSVETGDCTPTALDLLPGQPVTLGRSRDSSVVLKDDMASRLHAKLYFDEGRWVLRDFGLNGTKVGSSRVSGAADLADGSVIQIGDTRLRFTLTNDSALTTVSGRKGSSGLSNSRTIGVNTASAQSSGLTAVPPGRRPDTPLPTSNPGLDRRTPDNQFITRPIPMPEPADGEAAASRLKVDELTALCRFMTAAVGQPDVADLIRLALRTVLNQTAAKVAGYLSLDPADPTPRFVLPEQAAVDVPLSRRLTERVRTGRRMVWLFNDDDGSTPGHQPTESLSAFQDAVCLPLTHDGEAFAAVHAYRAGMPFAERDVRFIEAVGGHLSRALEVHRHRRKLEAENNRLRAAVPTADELMGDSSAMMALRQQIARAAPQPFTVLIQGESGSGKELVAQALHRQSSRGGGPLVVVNCAAIAPTLLEAELFGYKRGAFSGADHDHPGLFEQADEGTLFLDEVGELSLECQAKLLRVIEGKPFRPVGGTKDVKVDVRVVAATHRELDREVKGGRFRQDLLFRLKVIPLAVPPLREHAEDVPELARFFLERLSIQCRRPFKLTGPAMRKLQGYAWPGNVRHLRAVLESAAVMCETDTIDASDLPLGPAADPQATADLPPSLDVDELETWAIRRALRQTGGNVSRAAQILGMSRDTLHTKLKKKGIDREAVAAEAATGE